MISRTNCLTLTIGIVALQCTAAIVACVSPSYDTFRAFKSIWFFGHLAVLFVAVVTPIQTLWRGIFATAILWGVSGPLIAPLVHFAYLQLTNGHTPAVGFSRLVCSRL